MADQGFWPSVFAVLPHDEDAHVRMTDVDDATLADLRGRIKRQELPPPPKGEFTTNSKEALNKLNRLELQSGFIRYRRLLHGFAVRAYVPVLTVDDLVPPVRWGPRPAHPWADTRADPEAGRLHARVGMARGIGQSISIYGPMLVDAGLAPAEVEALAQGAVSQACARLPVPQPQPATGAA